MIFNIKVTVCTLKYEIQQKTVLINYHFKQKVYLLRKKLLARLTRLLENCLIRSVYQNPDANC